MTITRAASFGTSAITASSGSPAASLITSAHASTSVESESSLMAEPRMSSRRSAGVPATTVAGRRRGSRIARRHAVTGSTRAGGAGAGARRRLGDEHRGLGVGGENQELRLRAFGSDARERGLQELRHCGRVVWQNVQNVLIARDRRPLRPMSSLCSKST